MKTSKFYILLAPIIISAILCAYLGSKSYKEFTNLKDLNEKLYKQSLVFQAAKSIIEEHDALVGKSEANTKKLRDKTLKNAQNFINSVRKDDVGDIRNINKLKEVLANLDQKDKFDDLFYDFFQNISGEINTDFKQYLEQEFPLVIKGYTATLSQFYRELSLANDTKYYIKNIFMNDPSISTTNNLVMENIYSIQDEMPDLDLLPKSELKENIYNDFNRFEANYQVKKIKEVKAKIAFSAKLSINDIMLVKQYEDDKFLLLLNSTVNIEKELLELTTREKLILGTKTLFAFSLCSLLIFSFFVIFAKLKSLKIFDNKSKYISRNLLNQKGVNANNAISKLINAYEDIKDTYTKDSNFYQIKDKYILSISKKIESINKEILASIAALKIETNNSRKQAFLEVIEKNTSVITSLYNIAKNISNVKKNSDHNSSEVFDPQKSFEEILQTNIIYSQNKKINFISYLDPSLTNELEGDLNSLKTAFNSIFLASLSMSAKYQSVIIKIKKAQNDLGRNGLCAVSFSIKNNSAAMSEKQISDILSDNEESLNDEESEFYLKIAQFYLKNLESKLEISSLQGIGNEFKFVVIFKTTENHKDFNIKCDHKLAFLQDANIDYNDSFEQTVKELGLQVDMLTNINISTIKNYDAIFLRSTNKQSQDIKNPLILKDPLTPSNIARLLSVDDFDIVTKSLNDKPKFLIYDTNEIYIDILASGFSKFNCEVVGVCNRKDLRQAIRQVNFDLIFISSKFLEDEKNSLTRNLDVLKMDMQSTKIPLILMLSNTSNIDKDNAIKYFDADIKTPINSDDLTQIFKNLLPHFSDLVISENSLRRSENIILFKKSPMENKIFSSALGEFYNTLETANSFGELLIKMKTKTCGIVLADESAKDFNYNELVKTALEIRQGQKTDTRVLIFGTQEKSDFPFVKILAENITKADLAATVREQIDSMGDNNTKDSYEFIKFNA